MQLRIPYFIFGQILIQKVTLKLPDDVQQVMNKAQSNLRFG